MIKFNVENGELKDNIEFGGSIPDMITDIFFEISVIYGAIKDKSSKDAAKFKEVIIDAIGNNEDIQDKIFDEDIFRSVKAVCHVENKIERLDKRDSEKEKRERLIELFKEMLEE